MNYVLMIELGKDKFRIKRTDRVLFIAFFFITFIFIQRDFLNKIIAAYETEQNKMPEPRNNNSWRSLAADFKRRGDYTYVYVMQDTATERVWLHTLENAPKSSLEAIKIVYEDYPESKYKVLAELTKK